LFGVALPRAVVGLSLGVLPILAVSALDDVRPVRAGRKLLAHVADRRSPWRAFLGGRCTSSTSPSVGRVGGALVDRVARGVTSAFNLIDGLGLAADSPSLRFAWRLFGVVGQPVMAGARWCWRAPSPVPAYNPHPARLFLGDSAMAIGFGLGTSR
jgi:UDP-N-acetylmuramyl pentapeptide phosphotransferase/UDP-N-acetylglucosamine-1-phosphate transferase